jgi:cyanophycinase
MGWSDAFLLKYFSGAKTSSMRDTMKGILIPVGGNEDKGAEENLSYTKDFVSDGILWNILDAAKGVHSKTVIIPSASSIPEEVSQNYLDAFRALGCDKLSVLNFQKPSEAEDDYNCQLIAEADCIMMTGGDQSKLTAVLRGTRAHTIMQERIMQEPLVIGGTSAGAMAMSTEMITGGSSSEALIKGAVGMSHGLCLMPELIIDSHFIRRGRFGRLAEAVAIHPDLLGVGLAEDTGIIIREGNKATVIGSGMVIVFDPSELSHNKHEFLKPGTPMSMGNLTVHILSNGDQFSIKPRTLRVLPMVEPFI